MPLSHFPSSQTNEVKIVIKIDKKKCQSFSYVMKYHQLREGRPKPGHKEYMLNILKIGPQFSVIQCKLYLLSGAMTILKMKY